MTPVLDLLQDCRRFKLDADPAFWKTPLNVLEQTYNGCGADWQPEWLRDLQTDHFQFFEPCFLIHDWDFKFLPKDRYNFDLANNRMYHNGLQITAKKISWWRFLARDFRNTQAIALREAVDHFAFKGFMQG